MLTVRRERRDPSLDLQRAHAAGAMEAGRSLIPSSLVLPGGRVVFLDVNGDGLPDAVAVRLPGSRAPHVYQHGTDVRAPCPSIASASPGLGDQDTFFRLAAPLDYNGDGRQDLLMPVPPGTLPNTSDALPALGRSCRRTGRAGRPTFTLVDPHIPFEAALGEAITLADPRGPRVGDLNGDGAADVVLPLGGVFNVFENLAAGSGSS